MKILYIGYWGANEGLSQATINPHLEILCGFEKVECVLYVSVERSRDGNYQLPRQHKLIHRPIYADRTPVRLLNKVMETIGFGRKLVRLARQNNIDLVICRSSLAGNWGLEIHRKLNTPFVVESFEPHADYMRELSIWKPWGISYWFQQQSETSQKMESLHLYPVAENYKRQLISEGVPAEKITTVPCAVDSEKFAFDPVARTRVRRVLGITDKCMVGIYVGKFGGMYFSDVQSFELFKQSLDHFGEFHLILLTPQSNKTIEHVASRFNFPKDRMTIRLVPYTEVPEYLSAADFAYSLHFPSPAMRFVCPIKNGEYWANGLPVVMADGIGDDSASMEKYGLLIKDCKFSQIDFTAAQLSDENEKFNRLENQFRNLALKNRSFSNTSHAYSQLLSSIQQ